MLQPAIAAGAARGEVRQCCGLTRFRQLAASAETEQDRALYLTAAFTGLRFGELAALRWSDIDWQRELIHVRRALARGEIEAPKSGGCAVSAASVVPPGSPRCRPRMTPRTVRASFRS